MGSTTSAPFSQPILSRKTERGWGQELANLAEASLNPNEAEGTYDSNLMNILYINNQMQTTCVSLPISCLEPLCVDGVLFELDNWSADEQHLAHFVNCPETRFCLLLSSPCAESPAVPAAH